MALLASLLSLGAIVALHELGHLLVARACRMRVDRYSIGFGPVVLSFKLGATQYALSLLPFGGYVTIAGMNPHDGTPADDPRSYANRPAWQRLLVLLAGPGTNYLMAFAVLAGLNFLGRPKPVDTPTIGEVQVGSAAALAGLKPEDLLQRIGEREVHSFAEVRAAVQATLGKPSAVTVLRAGQPVTVELTPRFEGGSYIIGAVPKRLHERLPLGEAVASAAHDTLFANVELLAAFADKLRGRGDVQIGGTVEAVSQSVQAAHQGVAEFFLYVFSMCVGVALLNLLPVPALDGGRILFVLVELVRRRPVNPRFETAVHALGFLLLLGLMAFLTVGDVRKHLARPPAPDAGMHAP